MQTSRIIIHHEFWDDRTGREILADVFRAVHSSPWSFAEDLIVFTPWAMDMVGSEAGEVDLIYVVTLQWDAMDPWTEAHPRGGCGVTNAFNDHISYTANVRIKALLENVPESVKTYDDYIEYDAYCYEAVGGDVADIDPDDPFGHLEA